MLFNAVNSQQTTSHNIATVSWRANNIQPTPGQRVATSPFDRLKPGIHLLKRLVRVAGGLNREIPGLIKINESISGVDDLSTHGRNPAVRRSAHARLQH